MPEALWHFFLGEKRVLMVAGQHGTTTSTAIMAHVLNAAGRDPSMLVGGVAKDFSSNYRLGAGRDFVIEGDEYDTAFFDKGPKFLHYRAQGAILTAVEFDHADIYRDLEHVQSSFRALAARNAVLLTTPIDPSHSLYARWVGHEDFDVDVVAASYRVVPGAGIDWANNLSQWLAYKPYDPSGQLMAEAHVYGKNSCSSTSCFDANYAPVAAQVQAIQAGLAAAPTGQ